MENNAQTAISQTVTNIVENGEDFEYGLSSRSARAESRELDEGEDVRAATKHGKFSMTRYLRREMRRRAHGISTAERVAKALVRVVLSKKTPAGVKVACATLIFDRIDGKAGQSVTIDASLEVSAKRIIFENPPIAAPLLSAEPVANIAALPAIESEPVAIACEAVPMAEAAAAEAVPTFDSLGRVKRPRGRPRSEKRQRLDAMREASARRDAMLIDMRARLAAKRAAEAALITLRSMGPAMQVEIGEGESGAAVDAGEGATIESASGDDASASV